MLCPDCRKEVGFRKDYCPHCSADLTQKQQEEQSKFNWNIFKKMW